jgi:hypothetical protein
MAGREQRMLAALAAPAPEILPSAWLVERGAGYEVYSNGLRIETRYAVSNRPRGEFHVYDPSLQAKPKLAAIPAGIVFHTTESHLAPFDEAENRQLKRVARGVMELVRQNKAYHYLIDRFGRVFRIVEETDAANHAGISVWADPTSLYINLNDSFLGVAFEGQTRPGVQTSEINPAQIAVGRILTEVLRARYRIPAVNCVTHAQVSVNPNNFRIGNHVDWAGNFPFAEIGLPDNYAAPTAALWVFGFEYDSVFLEATGTRWPGLDLAVDRVRQLATAEGISVARYQRILQDRYRRITASLKKASEEKVESHESN